MVLLPIIPTGLSKYCDKFSDSFILFLLFAGNIVASSELIPAPSKMAFSTQQFELEKNPVLGSVAQQLLLTFDSSIGAGGYYIAATTGAALVPANISAGIYFGFFS